MVFTSERMINFLNVGLFWVSTNSKPVVDACIELIGKAEVNDVLLCDTLDNTHSINTQWQKYLSYFVLTVDKGQAKCNKHDYTFISNTCGIFQIENE